MTKISLNDLINPKKLHHSLKINEKFTNLELFNFLKKMILIRQAEKKLAAEKKAGNIIGPVHLTIGQEAVAVGISNSIKKYDRIFGGHRSHSQVLSLGANLESFFAEILGRKNGLSKGMGGSMHLWDKRNGFYGSVPIVSGTVSIAAGSALASKMDKKKDIAIAYMGDSAMEEGVVHETLNIASLMQLPIIFVVENNLFGSHLHINQRQPLISTTRFAESNNIESILVDGNDVIQVATASEKLIKNARNYNKPAFIEAITYRWLGHVDWREDIDVGVNRSKKDLENWKKRDPIKRLKEGMIEHGILNLSEYNKILSSTNKKIDKAWGKALKAKYPSNSDLLRNVYQ